MNPVNDTTASAKARVRPTWAVLVMVAVGFMGSLVPGSGLPRGLGGPDRRR